MSININNYTSLEVEKSVIGCFLVDEDTHIHIKNLDEIDFYFKETREIYIAINLLNKTHKPIDLITVKTKLMDLGYQDAEILNRLISLTEMVVTVTQIEYYIKILKNLSVKRQLLKKMGDIAKRVEEIPKDAESIEIKTEALNSISEIKIDSSNTEGEFLNLLLSTTIDIEEKYKNRNDNKYKTCFFDYNKALDGLHPQELTIIAARPGMGKTAFALQLAESIAENNVFTYIVSLEMSGKELIKRIISRRAEIDSHKIRLGQLTDEDFEKIGKTHGKICNLPIFIDSYSTTIQDIEMRAVELKEKKNLGLVVIDYLQLLKSKNKFNIREQEVAEISRKLKLLAKRLNIPIIALCQLNRETEKRRRPILADLRESGSLEQDADNVIFLHADDEEKENKHQMKMDIIIAKQRNGPTGKISLVFVKRFMQFRNLV